MGEDKEFQTTVMNDLCKGGVVGDGLGIAVLLPAFLF